MRPAFALLALLVSSAAATATARADGLTCYPQIPAAMISTVTSQSGFSGQVFTFRVTATTRSNGITYPAGSTGYGVVLAAIPASNRARDGIVVLEPRYVIVGGTQIQVAGNPKDASVLTHGANPISQGAGAIPVPGVGFVVNEVVRGSNITIGPGYDFHVVPVGNLQERGPCVHS